MMEKATLTSVHTSCLLQSVTEWSMLGKYIWIVGRIMSTVSAVEQAF